MVRIKSYFMGVKMAKGYFNKMTNTEQATYMINSLAGIKKVMSDEGIDVDDSTQFSEYPVLLKQDADNVLVKGKNGVSGMEATSGTSATLHLDDCDLTFNWEEGDDEVNLVLECLDFNGNNIPVDLIVKKRVENTSPDKGSFDKASQTLTLNNSYVIGLVNQVSDELPTKQIMLETIGSNDLVYDFSQATTYPNTEMLYCPANIEYQGNPLGFVLSMSGGSYTIIVGEGVSPVNEEGLNKMLGGGTIQDLINMGGVADENVFTITGTQGNYDVTFN